MESYVWFEKDVVDSFVYDHTPGEGVQQIARSSHWKVYERFQLSSYLVGGICTPLKANMAMAPKNK